MNQNDEMKAHDILMSCHPELRKLLLRTSYKCMSSAKHMDSAILMRMACYAVQPASEKHYSESKFSNQFPYDTSDWLKPISDFCNLFFSNVTAPYNVSVHFVDGHHVAMVSCRDDIVMFSNLNDSSILALANMCKEISEAVK